MLNIIWQGERNLTPSCHLKRPDRQKHQPEDRHPRERHLDAIGQIDPARHERADDQRQCARKPDQLNRRVATHNWISSPS